MWAGSREKTRTHKLQIIAQARLPQVTTSARKLPVGKQLNLALTKQRILLEHRSKAFLQPLAHFIFYLTVTFRESHVHKTKEYNWLTLQKFSLFINSSVLQVVLNKEIYSISSDFSFTHDSLVNINGFSNLLRHDIWQ